MADRPGSSVSPSPPTTPRGLDCDTSVNGPGHALRILYYRSMRKLVIIAAALSATFFIACGSPTGEEPVGVCEECVEINTAPPRQPPDPTVACEPAGSAFTCRCITENGDTENLSLTSDGCVF